MTPEDFPIGVSLFQMPLSSGETENSTAIHVCRAILVLKRLGLICLASH